MDVTGFILEIIVESITIYLVVIFFRAYSQTRNSNFLVLGSALSVFFIIGLIENIGSNIMQTAFFDNYYLHHFNVIFILLALVYTVKSSPSWKMKLEKKKRAA